MGHEKLDDFYDANFYGEHVEAMTRSASVVLELLYKYYQPKSVIDVGCGRGAWLAAAESLGSVRLKGVDGTWVKKDDLLSKNIDFVPVNLAESFPVIQERYDLCISLEVAEHISKESAKQFVELLCNASDIVLFGAAIRHQGGANHINEQWQSYWVNLFKNNGYECFDVIRAELWNNKSVEWWYKQNTLLFVSPNNSFLKLDTLRVAQTPVIDIAHPSNYERKVEKFLNEQQNPTFRSCLGYFKRFLLNLLR